MELCAVRRVLASSSLGNCVQTPLRTDNLQHASAVHRSLAVCRRFWRQSCSAVTESCEGLLNALWLGVQGLAGCTSAAQ